MTIEISNVPLYRVSDQVMVPALLLDGIPEKQLVDWEQIWQPELKSAIARLHAAGTAPEFFPQSAHWNWRIKTSDTNLLAKQSFSIICDGVTQGMMIVDTVRCRCQLATQRNKELVYVEYLENAPWNRKELLYDPPRFRGVGSILIRVAIEFSKKQGFDGRIGLHALPQADSFYRDTCGMTDCGEDTKYYNLRYFEMTLDQVKQFNTK